MTHRTRPAFPALLLLGLLLGAPTVAAASDVAVRFQVDQATAWGESVYLLGDLPALGHGDPTRALRMVPAASDRWSLEVALPAGASYRYTYLIRSNDPARAGDADNAWRVAPIDSALVPGAPAARTVRVHYYSGWQRVWLRLHEASGTREVALQDGGPGRRPGERCWTAAVAVDGSEVAFDLHDGAGGGDRAPGGDVYRTGFATVTVADGQVFDGRRTPSELSGAARQGRVQQVARFDSKLLGNTRPVWVYLPRGYDRTARRYPVVYMHDGQNLFGPNAMFGGWGVEEACDRLIAAGQLPELIVVGVGNTPRRMDEYIPDPDGGDATRYGAFLSDELKPWVDRTFRTRPEREQTGLVGSSLGGIVSLYLGWTRAEVFSRIGSLSGSYWLRTWIEAPGAPPAQGLRVWIDSGDQGPTADGLEGTVFARDQLLRRGFVLGGDLGHGVARGGAHNEPSWRRRVGDVLRFLFPPE